MSTIAGMIVWLFICVGAVTCARTLREWMRHARTRAKLTANEWHRSDKN